MRRYGSLLGFMIRTSSFAKTDLLLKNLSNNPGTKDRPKYVHADSISIQGTVVTLVVGGTVFTGNEIEYDKVVKKQGLRNQEEPISYYYYDVRKSIGSHLRIWVTENEMIEALLR